MQKLVLQVLVTAAALWVAVELIDGIEFLGEWWELLIVALALGLINTFVRPVLRVLTLPITLATLGLFLIVINGLMLLLAGIVADDLGIGFFVRDFAAALLGAILVSLVSLALNVALRGTGLARRLA